MFYRASKIVALIQGVSLIEIDTHPVPVCPKTLLCKRKMDRCAEGSNRQCVQKLDLFCGSALRSLYFSFTVSQADKDGIIDENDKQLAYIAARYNIDLTVLEKVA